MSLDSYLFLQWLIRNRTSYEAYAEKDDNTNLPSFFLAWYYVQSIKSFVALFRTFTSIVYRRSP